MLLALWQIATMLALVWPVNAIAQPDTDSKPPGVSCHDRHVQSTPAPSKTHHGCCHIQDCSDQCGQQLPVVGSAPASTLPVAILRAEPRSVTARADQRLTEFFRPPINVLSVIG